MPHGKWTVYPLTDAFMSVAQYLVRRMDEQDQLIFVKPNGYPIPEKSFAELENARENRVTLTEDVDMAIRTSAGLMIADGTIENSFRTKVLTKAKAALDQGKSVICALALTEDEVQQFRPYGEQFRYYTNAYQDLPQLSVTNAALTSPKSVIIGVGRILPEIDSLAITLAMEDYLTGAGYRVKTILDKPYAALLGMYPLPDILYNGSYGFTDVILELNHYIEALESEHRPDITLIQLPGGMQKYNNGIPSDLGIYSYLLSQAVQLDYLFCCFPFHYFDTEYLRKLSHIFSVKYSCELSSIFLSHDMVNEHSSEEMFLPVYFRVSDAIYQKHWDFLQSRESQVGIYELAGSYGRNFDSVKKALGTVLPAEPESSRLNPNPIEKGEAKAKLTALLNRKFQIPLDVLTEEHFTSPLTAPPFFFGAQGLTYLFFEVEKLFQTRIDAERILHQEFNTIEGILQLVSGS